jgi:hypothetical protein
MFKRDDDDYIRDEVDEMEDRHRRFESGIEPNVMSDLDVTDEDGEDE